MSCYLVRTMKTLNMMPGTWWIFDMLTDYILAFSAFILGKNIVGAHPCPYHRWRTSQRIQDPGRLRPWPLMSETGPEIHVSHIIFFLFSLCHQTLTFRFTKYMDKKNNILFLNLCNILQTNAFTILNLFCLGYKKLLELVKA